MSPLPKVIRVAEHQVLRIGHTQDGITFEKRHLALLERLSAKHGQRLFVLVPQGVRFKQYVGAIGLGDLTLEILPKLARASTVDRKVWQQVLLEMLAQSSLVEGGWQTEAQLHRASTPSLLEWCLYIFLKEAQQFAKHGLPKVYQRVQNNASAQRGRLMIAQQIRHNYIRKERFYAERQYFTYNHVLNRVVLSALLAAQGQLQGSKGSAICNGLIRLFRAMGVTPQFRFDWEKLRRQNPSPELQKLLDWCQLILQQYQPAIRSGNYSLMAILFDMQALFEDYIYRVLLRTKPKGFRVLRQQSRPFWQGQHIRPDILVEGQDQKMVIDTKWKQLDAPRPSSQDLKQLYVYAQYFGVERGVLIYPGTAELEKRYAASYAPVEGQATAVQSVLLFVQLIENDGLNRRLGATLWHQITSSG